MRWWLVWIPSFCVGQGIVWSETYKGLIIARRGIDAVPIFDVNQPNPDLYAMANLGGNFVIMAGTGVFCTLLLFILEADIFQKCTSCTCRKKPEPVDDIKHDPDVAKEEDRVLSQSRAKTGEQALETSDDHARLVERD